MKNYTQLTEEERLKIFELRQLGHGVRSIARILNRDKATIYREFDRDVYSDSIEHLPDKAHTKNHILQRKIDQFYELNNYIFIKLQEKWSPDVIAEKAKEDIGIDISSESIYQYCYNKKNKTLGWCLLLTFKRKKTASPFDIIKQGSYSTTNFDS